MPLIQALGVRNVVIYIIVINLIAFLAMGIDKRKAKKGKWRIPEATLMSLVLLGGGFGGIAGMYKFRHKTKKPKFYLGFPIMLSLEIAFVIYLLVNT